MSAAASAPGRRRLPVGAEVVEGAGAHFRVWAPAARRVEVALEDGGGRELEPEGDGHFSGLLPGIGHGALYRYRLDRGDGAGRLLLPDPASRFQPSGPDGPSMVVDPGRHAWGDAGWPGIGRRDQVLYELHVGTFTPEGTWRAAAARLPHLAGLGVTAVEAMPVAEFPGRFGWGYDGVALFAPSRLYGDDPDEMRRFVDEAHRHGVGVILDVVYNHLGPGNRLADLSPAYFSDRYATDWGPALNFDGEGSGPVRELVVANGAYWIEEFHLDGFRIDAVQNIYDFGEGDGHEHILAEFARRCREAAAPREILVVGENEAQTTRPLRPREAGGLGLDAVWNDDFHHSAAVALAGRNEAYLTDHRGGPQEFVSAAKRGFLFQGQRYRWQGQARGAPTRGLTPDRFVNFLQNHDQLANMGRGLRAHALAGPGRLRAMTALLLLGPGTPMLFQGQEFAASAPFHYFAGLGGEQADAVDEGRRREVSQFPSLGTPEVQAALPRPDDPRTFAACKLDWAEPDRPGGHAEAMALHRDLIRLRREDPGLVAARRREGGVDGAVLGPEAFCLRFLGDDPGGGDDRLLLVNLGVDLELGVMPEPLLAPPEGSDWEPLWSSERPAYGGTGTQAPSPDRAWVVAGRAALLLRPGPPSPRRKTELRKALDKAAEVRAKASAPAEEEGKG